MCGPEQHAAPQFARPQNGNDKEDGFQGRAVKLNEILAWKSLVNRSAPRTQEGVKAQGTKPSSATRLSLIACKMG